VSEISVVKNLPDISFIDGKTVEDIRGEMVADYEEFMTKATGIPLTLDRASPHRMELYSAAAQIYQAMQYIDRAGKQNLLKYSYSDYLDHLAAFKGLTREPEAAATTTVRFTLSAKREAATGIPVGTRVAVPDWSVYFATTQYMEIPAGSMTVDVPASCTVTGTVGNDLAVGELSKLVDPIPYMASVSNITVTAGGAEIESDDNLAERIYLFPGSYSTAGPEANYEYHAKKYNVNVGNVVVESDQAAGTVDIYFLMADGTAPPEEMITGLQNYLRDNNIRPMTDLVRVAAPEEVEYSINLTYYINRSDSNRAVAIQQAVDAAVTSYTTWQRAIGRDINPSKLGALIMAAGAKRVELTAPVHQTVGKKAVATLTGKTVQYGGLEDD
jgi:phage-related baseplate assembly protein